MHRSQVVVCTLLAGALAGCFTGRPERSASLFDAQQPFAGLSGDDVVQMDVAVLERPLGDRYVNEDLWDEADEQANAERRGVLERNGFRVCQIGGLAPTGLQSLLQHERSCPNPRRIRLHAGSPSEVKLGPLWARCRYQLHDDGGESTDRNLERAQCLLAVVPSLTDDGRVRLRFTPHVKHGEESRTPHVLQEPNGSRHWEWRVGQSDEAYPWLGWEVTVAPNEYVVVGTVLDQADTLGHCCFLPDRGEAAVQHLLVIRASRVETGALPRDESLSRSPPLALQAALSSARDAAH